MRSRGSTTTGSWSDIWPDSGTSPLGTAHRHSDQDHVLRRSTTTSLPVSDPGEHYQGHVWAYNRVGTLIGELTVVYDTGYGVGLSVQGLKPVP